MKLKDITRKGRYIASYYENGYQVIKTCTKKQFLRELSHLDNKQQIRICNSAKFERL